MDAHVRITLKKTWEKKEGIQSETKNKNKLCLTLRLNENQITSINVLSHGHF